MALNCRKLSRRNFFKNIASLTTCVEIDVYSFMEYHKRVGSSLLLLSECHLNSNQNPFHFECMTLLMRTSFRALVLLCKALNLVIISHERQFTKNDNSLCVQMCTYSYNIMVLTLLLIVFIQICNCSFFMLLFHHFHS